MASVHNIKGTSVSSFQIGKAGPTLTATAGVLELRDGQTFRILDSSNVDSAGFSHDGTNFNTTFTNTTAWDVITLASFRLRDGCDFVIFDAGDTDSATFSHDGADFNTVFANTTDWNITGLTGNILIPDGIATQQPVGYNTIPIYEIDANDIFDVAHAGMMWHKDLNAAVTFTCDNVAAIPQGTSWAVHNDDTEDLTIAQGSGVTINYLTAGGAPVSGNVTVEQGGIVTVYKYTDTEYWVWGDKEAFVQAAAATITVADTADTTTFPVLVGNATGDEAPLTDGGLTYNASTGDLTSTLFAGIANADLLDKTANEDVTGAWTFSNTNGPIISAAQAEIFWRETDAVADEKNWIVRASTGIFRLQTATDAAPTTSAVNVMDFNRVGTSVDTMTLLVDNLVAGTVDADFDAITATSYGGITESNLVDKTFAETISAGWNFTTTQFFTGTNGLRTANDVPYLTLNNAATLNVNVARINASDVLTLGDSGFATTIAGTTVTVDAALTATSYGGITEGDLVDKTAAETISGNWLFTGSSGAPRFQGGAPGPRWTETGAPTDEVEWWFVADGGNLGMRAYDDAFSSFDRAFEIHRTAENVDDTTFYTDGNTVRMTINTAGVDIPNALTAASYGGITEANLLDKSVGETITANWVIDVAGGGPHLHVQGGVSGGAMARFTRDNGGDAYIEINAAGGEPQIIFDRSSGTNQWYMGVDTSDQFVIGDGAAVNANDEVIITAAGNISATTFNGVALTTGGVATNYLDETGSYSVPPASSGNVSNTGTPLNNQLAVWTDATTIEGVTALTFDGTDLTVSADILVSSTSVIDFGNSTEEKVVWFGDQDAAGAFVTGIESNTLYHRSATNHRWYVNTVADGGTTQKMRLNATELLLPDTVVLRLEETADASLSSTGHAFQIGLDGGANMRMDGNEIMAINNGAASTLNINIAGGDVSIGSTSANNTSIMLGERTTAGSTPSSRGQFWVRDDAPNTPMFTADSGSVEQVIDPSISEINIQNGPTAYVLVLSDKGKTIAKQSGGGGETYTIPSNASVAYPLGTLIAFDNDGGGSLTISINSDTLRGTDGVTGSKTLGDNHRAVIQKITATEWKYAASDL